MPEKINELPQPFLEIVRRCVVKDARERVQRAEELIELLHRPGVGAPVVAAPVTAPVAAPIPVVVAPVEVEPAAPVVVSPVAPVEEFVPRVEAAPVVVPEPERKAAEPSTEIAWPAWVDQEAEAVEAEEPYVPLSRVERPKRWRIAVIAAVVLLVAAGLYAFMESDRLRAALGYATTKTDSTHVVSGGTPANAAQAPNTAAAHPDSVKAKTNAEVAPPEVAEKKPRKKKERVATETDETIPSGAGTTGAGEDSTAGSTGTNPTGTGTNPAGTAANTAGTPTTAKPRETNSGGTELTKYVLLLTTPATCSININNVPYGVLESGKTMKVYLSPGNYIIQATSTSNPSAVYTGRLVVQDENLNQVGKYTIPL